MAIRLVSDEKIAETSAKGNQEKWYDQAADCWYNLDQFGYEALTETVVSVLLEQSSLEAGTPFTSVRYHMERLQVHGRRRTGCSSRNFLQPGQSLITVDRLLSCHLGKPLSQMDLSPPALVSALQARPFNTTFARQMNAAQSLYGRKPAMPALTENDIQKVLRPVLEYYPQRDHDIIKDRVEACILTRQKKL